MAIIRRIWENRACFRTGVSHSSAIIGKSPRVSFRNLATISVHAPAANVSCLPKQPDLFHTILSFRWLSAACRGNNLTDLNTKRGNGVFCRVNTETATVPGGSALSCRWVFVLSSQAISLASNHCCLSRAWVKSDPTRASSSIILIDSNGMVVSEEYQAGERHPTCSMQPARTYTDEQECISKVESLWYCCLQSIQQQ